MSGSLDDIHSSLSREDANAQGLMAVNQSKTKLSEAAKDKIKLTDLIDKTKATKDERDVDADEVSAELQVDEHGQPMLQTVEDKIYAELTLRHDDTGADNDQIFLVDGDSLLDEILHDPLLDWSHGGQFLHIIFALEQYVRRFQEDGRIFRFIFFHSFGSIAWANAPLVQLVRERVIQHLRALNVALNEFENWWDQPFTEFLERVDPAFILVGDGNKPSSSSASSSSSSSSSSSITSLTSHLAQLSLAAPVLTPNEIICSMTLYLLSHHFRVIRLTELSFAGNCMYGFQFAMHQLYKNQLRAVGGYKPHEALKAKTEQPIYRIDAAKKYDASLASQMASKVKEARLQHVAYALTKALESSSSAENIEVAKSIAVATVLSKHLALDGRALVWTKEDRNQSLKYASFLATFHQQLLIASIGSGADDSTKPTAGELDIFDGRLVAFVLYALHQQNITTLGWSGSMESELFAAWACIKSVVPSAGDFLPLAQLKSIAAPGVVDVDENQLAEEARKKLSQVQSLAPAKKATSASSPSPPAASATAAPVKAAPAEEEEVPDSWEDEDVDDVPPPKPAAPVAAPPAAAAAAPAEDEFDSWEDAADEEEKKAVEPEPVAAAAPAVTEKVAESDSSEEVASLEAAALTPVIELDNKLVKEICAEVDTRLSAFGLLEQPDGPAVSLTSFAARYAIREGIVLDDEMDDEPKSVGLLTRREQRQASNMINYWEQYSKSLVGGRLVLREVVVAPTIKEDEQEDEEEEKKESGAKGKKGKDAAKDKPKKAGKPGAGGGKKGAKVEKESIKDKIRREVEEQQRLKDIKKIQGKVNIAATMSTLPGKIAKLDSELEQMGEATAIPAMLTLLDWCLEHWKQSKPKSDIEPAIKVFVMVHDIYRRFKQFLQPDEFKKIITVMIQIGFEEAAQRMSKEFVKESEGKFTDAQVKVDLKSSSFPATLIGLGYNRFQLEYCGPWMLRNVESAPDSRVSAFMPDKWQRQLLDVADANQSALIVAPTSSGKTFISYYVMKNVIAANKLIERSSERGVVVYVAPNKALVNQVSADVYQRYGLVFGQATGDFSDKALSSEVLITVPSVLEQLLLSPHRESWVKKLRWVIFDEVHLISSAGEGSIWERCLSLIRCPFLALSATVGNPSDFYGWLSRLDALRSRKVHLIVHETRWSDLEKGVFLPIDPSVPSHNPESMKKFDLRSMQLVPSQWASVRLHPCAAIGTQLQDTNEFPKEVSFTPRDSLSLYDALNKFAGNLNDTLKKDLQSLAPDTFFPELLIVKARAMEYEARLKRTLQNWLEAGLHKEVGQVMGALTGDLAQRITTMEGNASVGQSCYDTAFLRKHFFSLLLELYSRDQLPGIVFSNDPELCVKLCIDTVEKLEELESKTLEQESNSEEARAKIKQKAAQLKALKKKRDMKMKNKQAEEEAREADEFEDVEVETETDEYTVDPRFSFIDETEKMDKKELEYWVKRTLYKTQWKKSHPLIRALYRGIGVHHSGLVKQYRDLVETLFRGKHLKVVVATSTLALGVNMPARSTILAGDSKLLTPLQYRQMSGRAGRRGYDNVGNVIFFGIPPRKIFRLLKSPLNSLRGHFPVDNTLALRMMHRYSAATDKKDAMASLAPLLREPFFRDNWSGSKLLKQIEYHFRFNMDSLYSRALINTKGESYGLAALATHMHATDPSNFGLIALLESGHLHSMCKGFDIDKNRVARELLTLLAHLFYRVPIPAYSTRANFRASSANMIILPPIDPDVKKIIAEYNTESLKEFSNYLKTFAQIELGKVPAPESDATPSSAHSSLVDGPVHVHEHFYQLPTSGINFPWVWSKSSPPESSLMSALATAKVQIEARSPFVALSGHSDSFESARSLAETLRNGIFLDTKLIPVCMEDLDSRGNELQLNAYVVDFYVKQHFHSLVRDNRLSDAFVWGLLKNWDSLLENITLALRTLSVDPENDILIKAFDHLTTTFKQSFSAIVNV